jgi:predicted MFS family arabinose efflux permease
MPLRRHSRPGALRSGAAAPYQALRRTARDPRMLRVQLAWAAVMIAFWSVTVSLSVVAYAEGGSAAVAVALLARTGAGAVIGPAVGALVDRVRRQHCLLWGAALSSVATAGAALAVGSLVAVVVLATVVSAATTLFRAAQSAIMPELVAEPAELTSANVLSSAVEAAGVFLGPALAGLLLVLHGPGLAFAVAAALLALAALAVLGLRVRTGPAGPGPSGARGRMSDLLRLRAARVVLLLLVAQTVLSGGLVVLYPALAVDVLDVELSAVGVLTSAFGLGGVLGSLALFSLAGSRRLGLFTAVSLVLWSLPLLLVPVVPVLAPVLVLLVVVGGANVLFDVTSVTLMQRGVPDRLLGRAFGAVESAAVLGLGLGAVAGSALDALFGAGPAIAALALPLLVVALVALPGLRRLDREMAPPARQVELLRAFSPFAVLPPLEIERLALHLRPVELAPGEVAVRQGETGSTWFLVEQGLLDVQVDGRRVRGMTGGDAFGELALLRDGVRTATVVARSSCVLWALDGAAFLASLHVGDGRALSALDAVARERMAHAAPAEPAAQLPGRFPDRDEAPGAG